MTVPIFCSDFNVSSTAAVDCRNLDNPTNGKVDFAGTTFGSTATYTCNVGFELQGESTRTCQSNSQWSGNAPTCERMLVHCALNSLCLIKNHFLNSQCTIISLSHNDFIISYTTAVDCGPLANPTNGQVNLTGTIFRSTASYSCNEGFQLNGQITRECRSDGQWSGQAPTCDCKSLIGPKLAIISLARGQEHKSLMGPKLAKISL